MINRLLSRFSLPTKLSSDIVWNFGSFGILAAIGVLLNLTIIIFYGVIALGIFNQIYSIYILASQLAVAGIHLSVLRHAPQYSSEPETLESILSAGILLSLTTSMLVAILLFVSRNLIGFILASEDVSKGFVFLLPALIFFSVNKVIMAYINAQQHMRAYAIFLSLRYIMMYGWLIVLGLTRYSHIRIPIIFSLSEGVLSIILIVYVGKQLSPKRLSSVFQWVKKHFLFGIKALWGNLIIEFNSRVDVLILGVFATDEITGIYSFASMLANGLNQLPTIISAVINPIITKTYFENGKLELELLLKKTIKYSYLFIAPLGVIAIIIFKLIPFFWNNPVIFQGTIPFGILALGFIISAGYQPLQMVLNQTGFPINQSFYMLMIFSSSIILNFLLTPWLGMYGSALAMLLLAGCQVFVLKQFIKSTLSIRI